MLSMDNITIPQISMRFPERKNSRKNLRVLRCRLSETDLKVAMRIYPDIFYSCILNARNENSLCLSIENIAGLSSSCGENCKKEKENWGIGKERNMLLYHAMSLRIKKGRNPRVEERLLNVKVSARWSWWVKLD